MNLPKTHGGKRKGAGRKADWLQAKCAEIIDKRNLLNWLGRVAGGLETETQIAVVKDDQFSSHVEKVEVPCTTKDRIHAMELLCDRGFGRATQPVTLGVTENFAELLVEAGQRLSGQKPQ